MKPIDSQAFDRKLAEAADVVACDTPAMIRTTMNRSDWLILGALALIWGSAFFMIRIVVEQVPTPTYVWLRLTIAAAGIRLFLKATGKSSALPRQAWGAIAVLALFNNALPFVLIGWSETRIASALASILNATTPIFGVIVAHFATRDERMSPAKVIGVLIGFAGVTVMLVPTMTGGSSGSTLAVVACLVASLSYALAGVWARRFRAMGVSPMSVTSGQLTAAAAMMFPVAMIADRPWTLAMPSWPAWASIAGLALLCSAFAYILYFRLIHSAGAINASLVTLLVPVTAILLGSLLLGETLAATDFEGMALIALGLAAIDGRLISALSPRRLQQGA